MSSSAVEFTEEEHVRIMDLTLRLMRMQVYAEFLPIAEYIVGMESRLDARITDLIAALHRETSDNP